MKKFSILVVDDEKEMCISLSEILSSGGYRALYTVDPSQVPVLLSGDSIDLIIMDVRMPKISGIDLLKSICRTGETKERRRPHVQSRNPTSRGCPRTRCQPPEREPMV